jgi:hypothetical protein
VTKIPAHPKIYHITHLRNLPQIVKTGVLWSDAQRIEQNLDCDVVGMSHIKQRRLKEIEVQFHAGTHVGDYVPFYFCPRSIMLYILHMGNHPDLDYHEGQESIIHLQADLLSVIKWADRIQRPWAFSDRNAGNFLAQFYNRPDQLSEVDWNAVEASDFRDAVIKEGKQAEFLVHESFPWQLVEYVGACNSRIAQQVNSIISQAKYHPTMGVKPNWYY